MEYDYHYIYHYIIIIGIILSIFCADGMIPSVGQVDEVTCSHGAALTQLDPEEAEEQPRPG